jgi:hypothetical protein
VKSLEAELITLRQELEQAEALWQHFSVVRDIIFSLSDQGLAELKQDLIDLAEGSWDVWDHSVRCYVVQESVLAHVCQVLRDIAASEAAGIDPYSTPNLPLPSSKSWIGQALRQEQEYRLPNPLKLSGYVMDAERKLRHTALPVPA